MKTSLLATAFFVFSTVAHGGVLDPYGCNESRRCSFACPQFCEAEPREVRQGSFVSNGAHEVDGSVTIAGGRFTSIVTLGPDFSSVAGPDLRVVLRDSTGVKEMKVLGPLNALQGEQKFMLNVSKNELAQYDEVVIYCARFSVDFGVAKLVGEMQMPPKACE